MPSKFPAYIRNMNYNVQFLENQSDFDKAIKSIQAHDWIGFDTEFVGEKYFTPVLGLIQIVAGQDIYLVDTLKIKNLDLFLQVVSNPKVLKITHAGDNDYRLLFSLFDTVPQNTFDTQIAAGFVGYNYPAGFGKLVEKELRVSLAKSHTIADWEARPLDPKALEYAVEDVKYLPGLHQKLSEQLKKHKRESWAREENLKWESRSFYEVNPHKELFSSDLVHQLEFRDKIFLMRLYRWRIEKATELNVPKESVLQSRHITTVLRATKAGPNAFKSNRTMHEGIWKKNLDSWQKIRSAPVTEEEKEVLGSISRPRPENPEREWTMELLYHFVKKQCIEHSISPALLFPRGDFNRLKSRDENFDKSLLEGWRSQLMGKELVEWFKKGNKVTVDWQDHSCVIKMKP